MFNFKQHVGDLWETIKEYASKDVTPEIDFVEYSPWVSLKRAHAKRVSHRMLRCVSTLDIRPFGAKANVLIFHGYRSHLGLMKPVIEAFAEAGFNVFACDLPNHGKSIVDEKDHGFVKSRQDLFRIVKAAVSNVTFSESRGHLPTFIIGHSLGATLALRLLQTRPSIRKKVQGVVCASLPIDVDHNVKPFIQKLERFIIPIAPFWEWLWPRAPMDHPYIAPGVRDGFENDSPVGKDEHFYSGPLMLKTAMEIRKVTVRTREEFGNLRRMPILFLHGERDAIASYSLLKEDYDDVGSTRWAWKGYRGVGHDLFHEYEPSIEAAVKWIDAHVKRLEIKQSR